MNNRKLHHNFSGFSFPGVCFTPIEIGGAPCALHCLNYEFLGLLDLCDIGCDR
jgi:hypothetical protein